jgi:hypothetical protein
MVPLSDDELAAAAMSLPDLRQLKVETPPGTSDALRGLHVVPDWRHSAAAGGCGTSRCSGATTWRLSS